MSLVVSMNCLNSPILYPVPGRLKQAIYCHGISSDGNAVSIERLTPSTPGGLWPHWSGKLIVIRRLDAMVCVASAPTRLGNHHPSASPSDGVSKGVSFNGSSSWVWSLVRSRTTRETKLNDLCESESDYPRSEFV
jgi:hypothetical protein